MRRNLPHNWSYLVVLIAVTLGLWTGVARAALVINNPSFETPTLGEDGQSLGSSSTVDITTIPSWSANTIGGSGGHYGILNPNNNNNDINTGTVDGNNVAFISTANPGTISAQIYQDIGQISQSGSYTLTLLVGNRKDLVTGTPTIQLLQGSTFSGATALTSTSTGSNPVLINDAGNMVQWSFNYTIPANTDIWIDLSATGINGWVAFDNVQIQAVPEKENEALALFGILAVGGTAGSRFAFSRKLKLDRLTQQINQP